MPYLQIENGPQAGQRHDLKAASAVLGRHPDCDVVIDVGAVSRQHAKIERAGDSFFLEDLKSRNGTILNDQPLAQRRALADGDRLQICDITLVFHDDPKPKPPKPAANAARNLLTQGDSSHGALLVDDDEREEGGTTIMSTIDVGSINSSLQIAASAEAKLAAFLEINRCLGRQLALDEVLPQVLESLFRIFVQADRGFIILQDERKNLIPRWTKLRREDASDSLRISRTIVKQVMEGKEAVLSEDATSDKRFQMSQSITDFRIRSMMCAPLVDSEGNAFGVLQIDTLDRRKRFQKDDLDVLASVATQAGRAIDNARLHEQMLRQREVDRDLELARNVQRGIVPRKPPELAGYRFYHFYESANQVGGDYFDYVPLAGGRVAVVVADVVGHGVAAALLMARLSSQVRFCLAGGAEPSAALAQVNAAFGEIGIDSRFVTFWLGVLDPSTHSLTVANAGHMPTMIRRASGQVEEVGDEQTGMPLGVMDDAQYEQFTITLEPGEMVMMYTDGINESMDPAGELYTIGRLRERFGATIKSIEQFGESLVADVRRHMATAGQADDMCLVCFART
jgi:serine phosphatase RsbU (regulator of sigma subunit)